MFAASSAFRRTLLTASHSAKTVPVFTSTASAINPNLYRPIITASPRFFSNTSKMSKEGVHNLASKSEWDEALKLQDQLVVLDCFATWCGPCKVIAPQVVKFSNNYPEARFYKLDVDEVPDVAQELGIRAMPTFLLFKNGDKIAEVVGANPKALEAAIKSNYTAGESSPKAEE
ncbi:thioredoxin-like protein [Dendryphion nanum]|uniref:Thioredoxin-like protein n=1 Tax=Dendryphion nanum TaxID=256645 RepID=A0A9P9DBS7_9PLEO|nr:thioredoxin-like protein [Dendryphion nanum]